MPTDQAPKQLTEDEFDHRFTVVPDENGQLVRDTAPGGDSEPRRLWTIVEGDAGGDLYAVPGLRYVNRTGYLLTEQEWTDDIECAEWDVRGDEGD
ncbi:MAG: hypothetical protein Q4C81_04370 [Kocuria sp.]|nr:hypothetical protein [Kocuria sp.]